MPLVAMSQVPPVFGGDPEAELRLQEPLRAAMAATEGYGSWPGGSWELRLHERAEDFEQATGAPPARAAQWEGATLHLRPWLQLSRRDLGAVLRHELVHRRLNMSGLRRWEEEARCLHAESHVHPPQVWPKAPARPLQDRLDRALKSGATREQAWAYRCLRAWLEEKPLPQPPQKTVRHEDTAWHKEALETAEQVVVRWPEERLPKQMVVNGQTLSKIPGKTWHFEGRVRFGPEMPIHELEGRVDLVWHAKTHGGGWILSWSASPTDWAACAVAGELGDDAPLEARRALAAVLETWLKGHPHGHHPDGSLCPITHCAVVRGPASPSTHQAAETAPTLILDPRWALFTSSKGGVSWSLREVWGEGPDLAPSVPKVEGDRWADWERDLDAAQVQALKRLVHPGLKPGQKGLKLGSSGPYAVEELRLAAGRAFGWPSWPSNACEATPLAGGGLHLRGHGWGHNAGLCLATACLRAREGWKAEAILAESLGPGALK